jgi:hypothetical protein
MGPDPVRQSLRKGDNINAFAYAPSYAQVYPHGNTYRHELQAVNGNRAWSW